MAKQNCLVKLSGKINRGFQKLLQKYATFVFRYPCVPILGAILLFGILAYGFTLYEQSTDAIQDWVPQGAQALDDRDSIQKYYETQSIPTVFYLVAKDEGDNVITLDIYQAIKDFDTRFKEEVEYDGQKYADICFKPIQDGSCDTSNHPLDFFLNSDGLYDLSSVSSNSELLTKIQSGKGDSDLYPQDSSDYIRIASMFGQTTPKDITTNSDGTNDIQEAEAIQWTYFFNGDDFDQQDFY